MDGRNGYGRPRGPNGSSTHLSSGPPGSSSAMNAPPPAPQRAMNRAEKFEDEKRRIIDSCFAKTDPSGGLQESYITHIRIREDAQYPQSPPPPDSAATNKKDRVIVVAVKNTGRVRMHKGRENNNGSFSIGKTWGLEDMTGIESYTNSNPQQLDEFQRKEWAGDSGFICIIGKPYFWSAGSAKEKDFFIASLVKIYRKYTNGKLPELIGFSPKELEPIIGAGQQLPPRSVADGGRQAQFSPAASTTSPNANGANVHLSSAAYSQPPPAGVRSAPSHENIYGRQTSPSGLDRTPDLPTGFAAEPSHSSQTSRSLRSQASQDHSLRQPASRDHMRGPGGAPSQRHLTPQTSRSEINHDVPEVVDRSPRRQGMIPPFAPGTSLDALGISDSTAADGAADFGAASSDRWKSNGAVSSSRDLGPTLDTPAIPETPPERRRPPLTNRQRDMPEDPPVPPPLSGSRFGNASQRPTSPDTLDAMTNNVPSGFDSTPLPEPMDDNEAPIPAPLKFGAASRRAEPKAPPPPPDQQYDPDPPAAEPVQPPSPEEEYRPGLGPMFKKKSNQDVANKFRKAANAYGAFKPRAGGALDRLKKLDAPSEGQDGITGVFQAPKPAKVVPEEPPASKKPEVTREISSGAVQPPAVQTDDIPEVKVSQPLSPTPINENMPDMMSASLAPRPASPEAPLPKTKEEKDEAKKRRRRSQYQAKYLSNLGIEPNLIDTRAFEFDAILSDFGWGGSGAGSVFQSKKLDVIEADLRRELGRVEAGSWLGTSGGGTVDQKDERVDQVEKLLDRAIHEVEELEGLLTLYGVELSSLNDDIAFIEAQSQGLQVQTANQKLLQQELKKLIETVDINPRQLTALKDGQIGSREGLSAIENALTLLYKAMITIDPNIRSAGNNASMQNARFGDDLADMRALRERRDRYIDESSLFLDRLKQYMEFDFGRVLMDSEEIIKRAAGSTSLDPTAHEQARRALWRYSPLMLFAKDIDMISWDSLMRMYQLRARNVYQMEFRNNFEAWKKVTRKPAGDEHESLWTSADRDNDSLGMGARKNPVKRSMTLARNMRNTSGDKNLNDKTQIGRLWPYEAFTGALEEMSVVIFTEQNFIVEFFHASSTSNLDFLDAVMIAPPENRRGGDLRRGKAVEPDRVLAGKIRETMDEMLSFWPNELQVMLQWATQQWGSGDPLQGVGMMFAIDRTLSRLEDTNQEYMIRTLSKLQSSLGQQFLRLLDEQIKKIEDTKVKIKKRKGVIDFMRVFPHFCNTLESMAGAGESGPNGAHQPERTDTRNIVDDAYQKINRAMFDSLKVIAEESPALASQGQQAIGALAAAGADPEDKEALNYHILLIENMNYYLEEVEDYGDFVIMEWRRKAAEEMNDHLNLYVDSVVRRPLGKLMEFLDTTTPSLTLTPTIASSVGPSTTGPRSPHARSTFKKLVATHDAKDMRRGAEALRRRVEKHFGEDETGGGKDLVAKVLKRCEDKFASIAERADAAGRRIFEGEDAASSMTLGWSERDVRAAFKK